MPDPSHWFSSLIKAIELEDFHAQAAALDGFSHTMVGFNLDGDAVTSTKFYYVFSLAPADVSGLLGRDLNDEYASLIDRATHIGDCYRLQPGAGLTLTLKFDRFGRSSKGFFLRVKNEISDVSPVLPRFPYLTLSPSDFESGAGEYRMSAQGRLTASRYGYVSDTKSLARIRDVLQPGLGPVSCAEVSNVVGSNESESKVIFIAAGEAITAAVDCVPSWLRGLFGGIDIQYCCPAYSFDGELRSIYVIGRLDRRQFSCSPIHELMRVYGRST
jgi:hypothetical protein